MRLAHVYMLALGTGLVAPLAGCDPSPPSNDCVSSSDCRAGEMCFERHCRASLDGATPDTFVSSDTGPAPDAIGPDTGPPIGAGCSADLRDVLDATGGVLRTCEDDRGCSMGTCVPACEAAAAAQGTLGCVFLAHTPPTYPPALPPCHAVFLANAWPDAARVTITRAGTSYDASAFGRIVDNDTAPSAWAPIPAEGIPPDEVAVLFLSSDPAAVMPETGEPLTCPVTPAIDASTVIDATGTGDAWSLTSDRPVSAYDIIPFGGAPSFFPSAALLVPTPALGRDYVVIATPTGTASPGGPQWLSITASADATEVSIRPRVDLPGGGALPAVAAGTTGTFTLDAGEVAQFQLAAGATTDTSGTLVSADHDVAVMAGNRFFRLQPTPGPGGEGTHQQILPVDALGSRYAAAPYTTRRMDLAPEAIPYRLVGAVDGTTLTFDPAIAGAPTTLERGEVVDLTTPLAFVVASQDAMHPFALAQVMPTANLEGGSRPGAQDSRFGPQLGDEEFVIQFPPDQFLSRYVFFTDPTYWTTNLTLVRVREGAAFADVTVDCLGVVSGWTPIGASGDLESTTVDLVRAGAGVGSCVNGIHTAESDAPFGVVVWGTDAYASYAYPAGGNARQLAEIPPLF
ncbi:MAG: IgGFc-binding protein [Deltaproteobacteria bacterium]|nr:IgGFc-binding protein [Deltaproteobacteria bacterium]